MIQWLRASVNPVPIHYDCLLLLNTGDVILGKPEQGMIIVGWSILNRPEWIPSRKINHGAGYKASGERHGKAKLSDNDCQIIRDLYASGGISYAQVAEKFECSKSTIRDIVKYRTR